MKNKVQLITYVDRLGGKGLKKLSQILDTKFPGLFGGIHLLPFFYPIDGEDAGFDPIDHTQIDNRLGTWKDLANVAHSYEVMADMIVNHVSSQSPLFKDYLEKGDASEYASLFLRMHSVFPDGVTEEELLKIYRPRPGLPFSVYTFKDGNKGLFWTTFTKNQLDININHVHGWQYLINILNVFDQHGIKTIRLDATGYAVKKAGSSCFMLPETFAFIERLKNEANACGIEVLVEIHSHYQTQLEISKYADWVYDFALPPLILHALNRKTSRYLKNWLAKSPRNAITVLDTHDGIGIIDAGPSRSGLEDGLLSSQEIDYLVDTIHKNSKGNSLKATGAAASNVDLYQINCTFYEALGSEYQLYLMARLIQFFAPGIPQIYYVGLLAGENDMELLARTSVGRDINRHYYSEKEIEQAINTPIVQDLFSLIKFRNTHPGFDGDFSLEESDDSTLQISYKGQESMLNLSINFETLEFKIVSEITGQQQLLHAWQDFSDFQHS